MSAFCPLTFAVAIAVIASPLIGVTQDKTTVQGEWSLNRDLTPALPKKGDDVRQPEGRRAGLAAALPLVAAALAVGSAMSLAGAGVDRARRTFAS